jgi:hypothetical protein
MFAFIDFSQTVRSLRSLQDFLTDSLFTLSLSRLRQIKPLNSAFRRVAAIFRK